jgi:hypothetical protein
VVAKCELAISALSVDLKTYIEDYQLKENTRKSIKSKLTDIPDKLWEAVNLRIIASNPKLQETFVDQIKYNEGKKGSKCLVM